MTIATVKPALKRIEEKLDSINKKLCKVDPNCSSEKIDELDSKEKENEKN